MKNSAAVVYTVFVVITLLSLVSLFVWKTYQSRAMRISNFVARSDEYARRLDELMYQSQGEDEELRVVENLMAENPSIAAIQVFSKEKGLRLSNVKPAFKDFLRTPIAESEYFDGFLVRVRYHETTKALTLNDGFEATFVSTVVTASEIRNRLMIMLIVVAGMLLVTLVLILVNPRVQGTAGERDPNSTRGRTESGTENSESPDYIASGDDAAETYNEGVEVIEDFAPADRFDESDLRVSMPEYGESVFMEDDTSPNLDASETASGAQTIAEVLSRLDEELENAAASNQNLSLVIIRGNSRIDELVREHYPYPNSVFPIGRQRVAVIEANKDFNSSISTAREFLRECRDKNSSLEILCGIAARDGRLVSANVLYREAVSSLMKADKKLRIIGFRSDPEKYREFMRKQKTD